MLEVSFDAFYIIFNGLCFRIDIEVVVRENDGSTTLSAKDAVDVINQEKVKEHLKSQNFEVSKVALGELNKRQ